MKDKLNKKRNRKEEDESDLKRRDNKTFKFLIIGFLIATALQITGNIIPTVNNVGMIYMILIAVLTLHDMVVNFIIDISTTIVRYIGDNHGK